MVKRLVLLLCLGCLGASAEVVFEENFAAAAVGQRPDGWKLYGKSANPAAVEVIQQDGGRRLKIDDDSAETETGVFRDFPAKGGHFYRATVESEALPERTRAGALLQLRFLPGNEFKQVGLNDFTVLDFQAPPGAKTVRVYLYTHFKPTPALLVKSVKLEASAEVMAAAAAPAPGAHLKGRELYLETALVKNGAPAAKIVAAEAYRPLARRIGEAVRARTGVVLPIVSDRDYRDVSKLDANLILLGNRDDNEATAKLYMLYYTLLDAVYPGAAGHELRTLHNPFGDGHNIIFAGGSLAEGTAAAAEKLAKAIAALPRGRELTLPRLKEIVLDPALSGAIPASSDDTLFWGFARGYGKRGYFGWNSLSKNMALFYMTGDRKYAAEFLRLAFPTPEIAQELLKRDDEAYWDPKRPLATPYHYRSIFMVLYWDLIEEDPFFTEEQRLAVTRELYGQYKSNAEGEFNILGRSEAARPVVGDRHAAWEAMSHYCLGRYFDKYHPDGNSRASLQAARNMFESLGHYMALDYGSFFWYNTYIEPLISYAVMSDGRRFEGSAVIRDYGEALLALSAGGAPDWSDAYTPYNMLTKLAYLTRDEAYIEQLRMLKVDLKVFRLGQSWWPREKYPNNFYQASAGKFFRPNLRADLLKSFGPRPGGVPLDRTAHFLSYRQKGDNTGDFLLLDTKYESGRHPFHNFAILEFALNGKPVLRGYSNQLAFYRDGLATGEKSFITELHGYGRVGDSVFADGTVQGYNGHDWRRQLLLRDGRFLIAVDRVTAKSAMHSSMVESTWEPPRGGKIALSANGDAQFEQEGRKYLVGTALPMSAEIVDVAASVHSAGKAVRYGYRQPTRAGETTVFVTLVRPGVTGDAAAAQADGVAALRLPEPGLLQIVGDGFLLREADHLFGLGVAEVPGLFREAAPVVFDYDGRSGLLNIRRADGSAVSRTVKDFKWPEKTTLEGEVDKLLAGRARFTPAPVEAPEFAAAWTGRAGAYLGGLVTLTRGGRDYLFYGAGKKAVLADADGNVLRSFELDAAVGAVHYWPEQDLLLAGCRDEKLVAFAFDGAKKWEYTSQMAQELIDSVKFYWFKEAIPGVIHLADATLAPGQNLLFVGSAGTVEVLEGNGKLLRRFWQTWGAVSGSAFVPGDGKRAPEMRFYRFMGGNPDVYAIRSDGKGGVSQTFLGLSNDREGVFMGGYGFSMVGRYGMAAVSFKDGLKLVEGLNGVHNRLIVRSLDGKIEYEADLGPGFLAAGSGKNNYGRDALTRRNLRGFEVLDLDGDGEPEIVIAFNRKFVAAFDGRLQLKFLTVLPANPVRLAVVPGAKGLLAVGCFDHRVYLVDHAGAITGVIKLDGVPVALAATADQLIVGTEKGTVAGYRISR